MIGKILLTLLVLVLVVIYLRKQATRRQQARQQPPAANSDVTRFLAAAGRTAAPTIQWWPPAGRLPWAVWSLSLVLAVGGGFYTYHRWQENNRELTVLLYRNGDAPVVYRVPRHSLGERSFVTHDGVRVTVSASERMEVIGL